MDLAWKKLVEMEPRLADLQTDIQKTIGGEELSFEDACHLWHGPPGEEGFKHIMNRLVGFMAQKDIPELRTAGAHTTACLELYYENIRPWIR